MGGTGFTRRKAVKSMGALGAFAALGTGEATAEETLAAQTPPAGIQKARQAIFDKVNSTPLIDTHEHLPDESRRLAGGQGKTQADDWSVLLHHYLDSDLRTAGMPQTSYDRFFAAGVDPVEKWKLLEPYWPAVKNTGYGLAVRIAMRELYDVPDLAAETVEKVQAKYVEVRRTGFYKHILQDMAKIESCQVNSLGEPFGRTDMPALLMQDLSIVGMFAGPSIGQFAGPTGIKVQTLSDWHKVIDWWFHKYGPLAVAVKSQDAYGRDIDYDRVDADKVEHVFKMRLDDAAISPADRKALEDHLFWYAVGRATEFRLPVKLHTGYYAGDNYMPLERLGCNPGSACRLCREAPDTRFVFMHIGYPYYEEMIAVAKHYTNAYLDMCWAWIINPVAAKDFLKKYLVTAPANKILTFGGDYVPVEPVLGHAMIARRGIALALSELVEEGWIGLDDAMALVDPIMHANARKIFDVENKSRALQQAKWT